MSLAQTQDMILSGRACCIAADEALLRQLPPGRWIGGTIPYFMDKAGGVCSRDALFVSELPFVEGGPRIVRYDARTLASVCTDGPEHGFTLLLLPAFTSVHEAFAQEAPGYEEMYLRPLVGWVSGCTWTTLARRMHACSTGRRRRRSKARRSRCMYPCRPARWSTWTS